MFFNSIDFLIFMAVVYPLYLVLNHRAQNIMLLAASYVFYGYWDWRFLFLLLISTVVDYLCALGIDSSVRPVARKRYLLVSIFANLGLLGFFKYYGFFAESLAALLQAAGLPVHLTILRVILPAGISFYTFQTMSYTIDVYRREFKPTRDFLDFALYVSYFPQLVAGPIERARNLLTRVIKPRLIQADQVREGLYLIGWGLFKKIVIADNCALIANPILAHYQGAGFWKVYLALNAFAYQLYGDFSGYSDIARGLAKLMGFELMLNFRLPYLAVRPSDFWARWHISLTSWVRDYVFVSMGANKLGGLRTQLNLLTTMTLIGLWHGASWNFVLWGLYCGLSQTVNMLCQPFLGRWVQPRSPFGKGLIRWSSCLLTYHVMLLSFFFFRAPDMAATVGWLRELTRFVRPDHAAREMMGAFIFLVSPLLAMQVAQYRSRDLSIFMKWSGLRQFALVLVALMFIGLSYLYGADIKGGEEFIYFQF